MKHPGFGGNFTFSTIWIEWVLLNLYVILIGLIFFKDIAGAGSFLNIIFWGGLAICFIHSAVKMSYPK